METQLIEKTAKRFKVQLLLAKLALLGGLAWIAIAAMTGTNLIAPCAMFAVGALWRIYVKVAVWWHDS